MRYIKLCQHLRWTKCFPNAGSTVSGTATSGRRLNLYTPARSRPGHSGACAKPTQKASVNLLRCTLVAYYLFIVSGCETLRNEVSPGQFSGAKPTLVVTCFLSPQDLVLAAKVSRTRPVFESQPTTVPNSDIIDATVRLSQGSRSVQLRYDAALGFYRADVKALPIVAGNTYQLSVRTPAKEQATSTCTIPMPVTLTGTTFDSLTDSQSGKASTRYFVRARWRDPAGQANYYQVTGLFRYVKNYTKDNRSATLPPKEEVSTLQFDTNEGTLMNDEIKEGSAMVSQPAYLIGPATSTPQRSGFRTQYKVAVVILNLLHTSTAYYQYQDAIIRQAQVAGNPFAEPVSVPSNIQGALGCFGAYNRSTVAVRLK